MSAQTQMTLEFFQRRLQALEQDIQQSLRSRCDAYKCLTLICISKEACIFFRNLSITNIHKS